MFKVKSLTVKNFMSVGNATQAINFDRRDLTLVLGQNLDLGGDDYGARNGTGKTTIINALSYVLFNSALTSIKKDNLINKTNGKNMLVTIDFESNGVECRIERGRKPNSMVFYVGDKAQDDSDASDESQGDSRETQAEIERMIGMSHDMFKHIVALNTYTEPFLSLKANDQRTIIEQLLGITVLSEKADLLREELKATKDAITAEEYRIKAVTDANIRIQEQIDNILRRQSQWKTKHENDLLTLVSNYDELSKIDIDVELQSHKELIVYNQKKKQKDTHDSLVTRQKVWTKKHEQDINDLVASYEKLSHIDIDVELQAHKDLTAYNKAVKELADQNATMERLIKEIEKEDAISKKLIGEIKILEDHKCYACGQDFHDDAHSNVLNQKTRALEEATALVTKKLNEWTLLQENEIIVGEKPTTYYKTEAEAIRHSSDVENLIQKIASKQGEIDPYADQLLDNPYVEVGIKPETIYSTEADAIEHRSKIGLLLTQITDKNELSDPYAEQIKDMTEQAIEDIDFSLMNGLVRVKEHQDFLLKLLTNKDSFIRKRIIDQNLTYLNARLEQYLNSIGLPHVVKFQNDLTVSIEEMGRELDFDNLSRGERNRLILSLSWAFRDVWESLYQPINLLFIDEVIDAGMDTSGVESSLAILKKMARDGDRSVWLVSHKDELASRVNNVLKVVKENGFTSYNPDVEIV